MSETTLIEIRDLLTEIRDLLLPVADAHQADYKKRNAVRALLSTDIRRKAWDLADGNRTQGELAKASGMDGGNLSKLLKSLRELGAITDSPNPKRAFEVD